MVVDFKALKANAKKKTEGTGLCAVILGAGQAGKSTLLGTLPGNTLILHTKDEAHGVLSAGIYNKSVTGLCINPDDTSEDEALAIMLAVLGQPDLRDNFDCVCIDSISSVEMLIKASDGFKASCKSATGKYDKFAESGNLLMRIQELVNASSSFRNKGGHFLVTLPAHVKAVDADGGAETVEPMLSTYGVANSIPRMFDVVLFVTHAVVEGERRRVLDFGTEAKKDSKNVSGLVNKQLNFKSCLRGVPDADLPEMFPANLSKLLEFVKGTKGG